MPCLAFVRVSPISPFTFSHLRVKTCATAWLIEAMVRLQGVNTHFYNHFGSFDHIDWAKNERDIPLLLKFFVICFSYNVYSWCVPPKVSQNFPPILAFWGPFDRKSHPRFENSSIEGPGVSQKLKSFDQKMANWVFRGHYLTKSSTQSDMSESQNIG